MGKMQTWQHRHYILGKGPLQEDFGVYGIKKIKHPWFDF